MAKKNQYKEFYVKNKISYPGLEENYDPDSFGEKISGRTESSNTTYSAKSSI